MGKMKKGIIALTSTVMAFSAAVPVFAEGEDPADTEPVTQVTEEGSTEESKTVETQEEEAVPLADGAPATKDFWDDLNEDGYVEVGKYKVEKIKENVYHMDEGIQALPGGANDEAGNMNNPSSIYFVERDDEVLMVDLGNPAGTGVNDAKTIVKEMVGAKKLSILITHSHGDHTGLGLSTEVFDGINVNKVYVSKPDQAAASSALAQFAGKIELLDDNTTFTVSDTTYTATIVNAHTEGSLMVEDLKDNVLFTGDTFGS